jgi:Domain of unknown function (DUF4249)
MKKSITIKSIVVLWLVFLFLGCTEPYALKPENFEDVLVVEATITDQFGKQEIKISKASKLDDSAYKFVAGCEVTVKTNTETFVFEELNEKYISQNAFKAIPNTNYQLTIKTSDGKIYTSKQEVLTNASSSIQSIETKFDVKDDVQGFQIVVNSQDPTNNSRLYKYEYEETYKLLTPFWSSKKGVLGIGPRNFEPILIVNKTPEELDTKICYKTAPSSGIFITNTTGLTEDKVEKLPLQFIPFDDYRIANRYSVLVRQFVLNIEAYTFYKTLSKFSGSTSILSANQPGFISGNITSINNADAKVIGFFNVAAVNTKRIFFNYQDIYPLQTNTSYFCKCVIDRFDSTYYSDFNAGQPNVSYAAYEIRNIFRNNTARYFFHVVNVYSIVRKECGDCTTIGSNVKPTFWID